MYKIKTKVRKDGTFYYYFDKVKYPKRCIVWPNFIRASGDFNLEYCQNCGAYLDEYITGIKVDKDLSKQGICSVCGFNHQGLPEFYFTYKQRKGFNGTLLDMSDGVQININDFFYWACAESYTLHEEWFDLAEHLYKYFDDDGILGLVCWLKGKLPMHEIIIRDKRIIQVLLYLKKLTGVYFNPVTRDRLTKTILLNEIKSGDFCVYDLDIGVKKGWISEAIRDTLVKNKKNYNNSRNEIIKLIKEREEK